MKKDGFIYETAHMAPVTLYTNIFEEAKKFSICGAKKRGLLDGDTLYLFESNLHRKQDIYCSRITIKSNDKGVVTSKWQDAYIPEQKDSYVFKKFKVFIKESGDYLNKNTQKKVSDLLS